MSLVSSGHFNYLLELEGFKYITAFGVLVCVLFVFGLFVFSKSNQYSFN